MNEEGDGVMGWIGSALSAVLIVSFIVGALFSKLLAILLIAVIAVALIGCLTWLLHEVFRYRDY